MNTVPGDVGDGLPALSDGEPVMHRWFAIALIVLIPLGLVVTVFALFATVKAEIPAAARRPPGTATVTHDRGAAILGEDVTTSAGPACASGVKMVGDESARATARRALAAACQSLVGAQFNQVQLGLERWVASGGQVRVAVFERSGVDTSTRVEDGVIVIELNPKFQFEDAARAAPAIIHELTHIGAAWPGRPVTVEDEIEALQFQLLACGTQRISDDPARGCLDAEQALSADTRAQLIDAGYLNAR